MKAIAVFVITTLLVVRSYAAGERLNPAHVRVNFVMPLSFDLSPNAGWFDVVACGARGQCTTLITRIPISELKMTNPLETRFAADGTMQLLQILPDKKEVVWARQKLESGWYPPVELCAWTDATLRCRYEVEKDDDRRSLVLKIKLLD